MSGTTTTVRRTPRSALVHAGVSGVVLGGGLVVGVVLSLAAFGLQRWSCESTGDCVRSLVWVLPAAAALLGLVLWVVGVVRRGRVGAPVWLWAGALVAVLPLLLPALRTPA